MAPLETALDDLLAHPGVEDVLVLGRDGLLIQHAGNGSTDSETVSAMVPGIVAAAGDLGRASGRGGASTVVVRMERGVAAIQELSADLLLVVLVDEGVGFAPLLREIHQRRHDLAGLV